MSVEKITEDMEFHPQRVIVTFKDDTTDQERKAARNSVETVATEDLAPEVKQENVELLELDGDISVKAAVSKLDKNKEVESVEPDYVHEAEFTPNDPGFSPAQWHLNNTGQAIKGSFGTADADIDAPEAWSKLSSVYAPVTIAILDTGIDLTHPDLAPVLWANTDEVANNGIDDDGNGYVDDYRGYDWAGPGSPQDEHGHGTHVGGIAAGATNNGKGIAGVAGYPSNAARLMALRVLNTQGYGYTSDIIEAVYYAANNGAKVINMSLGGGGSSQSFQDAINYAVNNKKVVVMAAAGNSYNSNMNYPAGYNNVIGVGATTNRDAKAGFSTFNSSLIWARPLHSLKSLW